GERPGRASFAAVPVVLGGVVLISGLVGGGAYGANPPLGVLLGFVTACAYSGFLLMMRHANADVRRPAGPLADATAVAAVTAAALGVSVRALSWLPPLHRLGWLVLLAVTSQVLGWLLISYALPRLPALSTSLVLTAQPVGTLFLGAVLLSESPSAVQLAGVGLIVAGLVVATLGSACRA